MQARRSQRTGRKNNNDRIRELIALLGSLSRTGDVVSIEAISQRLGVGLDEARSMMDIVCMARGEDIGGLLISSNEDESEFMLQFPGIKGRPVRLSPAETIALVHALDVAGIRDDDPLRGRLQTAFWAPKVEVEHVRHVLGTTDVHAESLMLCARSRIEGKPLQFIYKGVSDRAPRTRRALVKRLKTQAADWYAVAIDLDISQERTFRIDRMQNATLEDATYSLDQDAPEDVEFVRITFRNKMYYTAFDWPGLRVIRESEDRIVCDIPYYGERSTWLLQRICAGNGSIIADDERIMRRAQEYAQSLL